MRFLLLIAIFFTLLYEKIDACTAFQIRARSGELFYCRSMEYGFPLDSNLLIVPRNTEFNSVCPGEMAKKWVNIHGYIGMNQSIDRTSISDGMNERGLVVGCLYMPGFTKYQNIEQGAKNKALAPWELAGFILGTCSNVKEVKDALTQIITINQPVPGYCNFFLPLHFYICDRSGSVLVVEYINGECKQYDNPLGVLTNSPSLDWHLNNLSNYVNLSPINVLEMKLGNMKIQGLGQGTGLLGLPGDFTPPSRFVRAALFSQIAVKPKTNQETVNLGFHLLNNFDITEGLIQNRSHTSLKNKDGTDIPNIETTQWIVVHDRTQLKTYFRTYEGLSIQMVDLKKLDFVAPGFRQIAINKSFTVDDITGKEAALIQD